MQSLSLNGLWRFTKLPGASLNALPDTLSVSVWETVSVPHTWYREDDFWRGLAVYEKEISRPGDFPVYLLSFDAVDQCCRVFVNGIEAGGHQGGYARFRLPVPQNALQADTWLIRVFVENTVNEDVLPNFGDFTVFGGITRSAALLCLDAAHFDRCHYGTDGLIVRTSLDSEGNGTLRAESHVIGNASTLRCTLLGEDGAVLQRLEGTPNREITFTVLQPALWNGIAGRHFYSVRAELLANGTVADSVTVRTGFRQIALDPEAGLLLNGRPVRLHGVARHQDRAVQYSTANEAAIREDFDLIREIGANAVRLSHYQHPQSACDCCDELGMLCWAEIPLLKLTERPALQENAALQLTELILQNIHHPAIYCWGLQNEIAMFGDPPFMTECCNRLRDHAKRLDPDRPTASANLYPLKARSALNRVTDLVGYNIYFGWYYGELSDYASYLPKMHRALPEVPFGITEYGVDANLCLHSAQPRLKDYSEEYQALYHETVYPQIEASSWLWGSFVWNMFDFSSARRNEGGIRFINAKGLVSHDRRVRKDAFYYYKARWSAEPFVHICSRRYAKRASDTVTVKCYTNQSEVRLQVNGQPFATAAAVNGTVCFPDVPLEQGKNSILAIAGDCRDDCEWERVAAEPECYRLPPEETEGKVKNWFLQENELRREGYLSILSTANDLLASPEACRVL